MKENIMKENICKEYCYQRTRSKVKQINYKMDKLELVIFDMDGVLTDIISSWKYVHDYFHTTNEKSVSDYVKGKINDKEFIKRDAQLWQENGKPVKKEKLVKILSDVPIMKGAEECISNLNINNVKTGIISAGLDVLANRIAKDLDINYAYSNGIKTDDKGYLNGDGIVNVQLKYKEKSVKRLAKKLDIKNNRIATVGNSCYDIPMFAVSGVSIAFNPDDECVKKAADYIVEKKDLNLIIPILKKFY
jgi:phosphoserine phosphatase